MQTNRAGAYYLDYKQQEEYQHNPRWSKGGVLPRSWDAELEIFKSY